MNNENNDLQNVNPTIVPEEAQPVAPETPVVEEPTPVVEAAPEVVAETPVVEPTPEVVAETPAPVMEPTPEVTPEVAPEVVAPEAPVVEPTPTVEPAPTAEPAPAIEPVPAAEPTPETPAEAPKKSSLPIIIIVVVVLIGLGVGLYFMLGKKDEPTTPTPDSNNTSQKTDTNENATKFLSLANKYVDAVDQLWSSDKMVCQDAVDQTKELKPSELSDSDSYGGPAYYYVFIDTANTDEMKLDVDDNTAVSGWIRIGKTDKSYYVALSDGKNYIVDTGTEFGTKSTALTAKDVVTNGNGNLYQYKSGEVIGSNTDGKGWGIGDYAIITDGDDSNDGIYMDNGPKTSGWTPFCSNVTE